MDGRHGRAWGPRFVDTSRKVSSVSTPPSRFGMRFTSSRNQRSRSLPAPNSKMKSTATEQSPSWQRSQLRQKYRYAPLRPREIRRLRLVGAHNRDEPLCGVLETVPLSTYSPYTAISYVWGDNYQPFQLLVGKNQYIPLTASLDSLLKDLRKGISEKCGWKHANRFVGVIWVDQICINQEDDKEKATQVEMMAEIYKTAELVITYIGPERPGDAAALNFIAKFYNLRKQRNPEGRELSTAEWADVLVSLGDMPKDDDQIWDNIKNILSGEWILRSWIFQEIVLNDKSYILRGVHCYPTIILILFGSLLAYEPELPFPSLLHSYSASCYVEPLTSGPPLWMFAQQLHTVGITRNLIANSKEKVTAFYLLQRNMNLRASIPRDKIYSLLNVAADSDSLGIVPDYSRLDVEIFTDLARRLFLAEQNLRILEYVHDAPVSSTDPWPSWVPNWAYTGESNRRYGGGSYVFNAGDSVLPTVSFSADRKSLILKGILVDTITTVLGVPCGGYFLMDNSILLRCQQYHQVYLRAMRAISVDPTSPSVEERKRFILVSTMGTDIRHQPVNLDQLWDAFCIWMDFIVSIVATPMQLTSNDPEVEQALFWYTQFVMTSLMANEYFTPLWLSFGRAMYFTSNKRLCMGPQRAQEGDKIAVLLGGRMCYILRPIPRTNDQYEFIGDAYCEGLMQGEALEDSKLAEQICDITIV